MKFIILDEDYTTTPIEIDEYRHETPSHSSYKGMPTILRDLGKAIIKAQKSLITIKAIFIEL